MYIIYVTYNVYIYLYIYIYLFIFIYLYLFIYIYLFIFIYFIYFFMYSLYFITLQRSGTRPVAKPLRSIRPEHRGTFHTQFWLGTIYIYIYIYIYVIYPTAMNRSWGYHLERKNGNHLKPPPFIMGWSDIYSSRYSSVPNYWQHPHIFNKMHLQDFSSMVVNGNQQCCFFWSHEFAWKPLFERICTQTKQTTFMVVSIVVNVFFLMWWITFFSVFQSLSIFNGCNPCWSQSWHPGFVQTKWDMSSVQ